MFADLCSATTTQSPHTNLNNFFTLYNLIDQFNVASSVSKSLTSASPSDGIISNSSARDTQKPRKSSSATNAAKSASKPLKPGLTGLGSAEKLEWAKGNGPKDLKYMRDTLLNETERWFLNFLEGALDDGFRANAPKKRSGRQAGPSNYIAVTLSQLKNASEWLDKFRTKLDADKLGQTEVVDRLKGKVYNCLLSHVESAASALESHSSRG